MDRHLIVLSCSSIKRNVPELLPAIKRYDGPYYKVFGSFLRQSTWPASLSIAILSAKYGLIGGLTPIDFYDQRMDKARADTLQSGSTRTLSNWSQSHDKISLILGKDYLPALDLSMLDSTQTRAQVVQGPIGMKLNYLSTQLLAFGAHPRPKVPHLSAEKPLYFLPDWDDMLDDNYDFQNDEFSSPKRSTRVERHCIAAMQPKRICDGVLVSLAQHHGSKGVLRKVSPTSIESLSPEHIRVKYGLSEDQWVFGDCGAFSYVNESQPTITTEQALSLYDIYGFDIGASVDHIPVPEIVTEKGKQALSHNARQKRVKTTKTNAADFISLHKKRHYSFTPVGIIQGLSPRSYARQLPEYVEMGYNHIAIGGLVPRTDKEIANILLSIKRARQKLSSGAKKNLWIHLFGVFRPNLQETIKDAGIASFDSATYFRKAWLRSDQNYFGADGRWYAAIRVPITSDPRTRNRLKSTEIPLETLEKMETNTLHALHEYEYGSRSLESTLQIIAEYDFLLSRGEGHGSNLLVKYEQTLKSRIWEKCDCPICRSIGIDVIIFRGYNRNKRRGAHNTLALYNRIGKT